jgi:hypothetical protein
LKSFKKPTSIAKLDVDGANMDVELLEAVANMDIELLVL